MKLAKYLSVIALAGLSLTVVAQSVPDEKVATLRQVALDKEVTPPAMQKVINTDEKQVRNYPMQPPVIPHKIDGYQIDLKVNKCMQCHARTSTGHSQAPMVSVTHYMDRDNNFLATLSPRRYYCTQCHVPQLDAKLLVENDFVDVHELMKQKQ
ncbi:nitrate reductase cytochrome c-type subunit [Shewanella sp. WXL01]|uniref:Periplasmic nitrate reductase, electron transfer subunit n=1 Tax=Shewanella maritima TaxID=2520507 RepID=A0A411PDT4_9GAMM|nr:MULTISPECIES: nitrate reductase cytochrome c-type subunit [Shewanella]NKF50248.1 nitrate reductase cytochrome c-type subunit [Shewanella sp. WXL01]QBF81719.1 nitrate reductase cytochrome c-type subunit [Shewanella maritima]